MALEIYNSKVDHRNKMTLLFVAIVDAALNHFSRYIIYYMYNMLYLHAVLQSDNKNKIHTCEPPDRRTNSPVFLGHLPISNILPYSPDFYMFLPYSPDFYMFTSQMCNLHHVH